MAEKDHEKIVPNPYEVLGLDVGASKEDVEKKYSLLIRKYRAMAISEDEEAKTQAEKSLKEVTDAYNSIAESELQAFRSRTQIKPNPLLKKMGVDEGKARNIVHYYKYHFIFGLIGLLVLGYMIYGFVTRVEPDFNLTVIGSFYSQDTEALKQNIKDNVPEVKEPSVEVITVGTDGNGQQEYAMQMKAVAVIAAGDIDVFVLDKDNFTRYAEGGAFASLDQLAQELGMDKEKCYTAKTQDPVEEHIYGLEAGKSDLLKNIQAASEEKIVAISARTKNYEKASKLVQMLIK